MLVKATNKQRAIQIIQIYDQQLEDEKMKLDVKFAEQDYYVEQIENLKKELEQQKSHVDENSKQQQENIIKLQQQNKQQANQIQQLNDQLVQAKMSVANSSVSEKLNQDLQSERQRQQKLQQDILSKETQIQNQQNQIDNQQQEIQLLKDKLRQQQQNQQQLQSQLQQYQNQLQQSHQSQQQVEQQGTPQISQNIKAAIERQQPSEIEKKYNQLMIDYSALEDKLITQQNQSNQTIQDLKLKAIQLYKFVMQDQLLRPDSEYLKQSFKNTEEEFNYLTKMFEMQ